MADWDISSPDDSGIVSQFPANERAARAAVMANFGVEHHETDDSDIGKHERITLLDQVTDPTIPAGQVGIYNVGGVLKTRSGAGTPVSADAFPAGTKMVFRQASAPTGWTQDTSLNDRVLRMVSGAGGGAGGSWTISGLTVGSTALTIAQMPLHGHPWRRTTNVESSTSSGDGGAIINKASGLGSPVTAPAYTGTPSDAAGQSIGGEGGGQGHTHGLTADGAWRPAYCDVLVASKN